jgi:transposase-like protein
MVIKREVLLAQVGQMRSRFFAAEKTALVEEYRKMRIRVSAVATKYDISPRKISREKIMKDGEMKAVETEEEVGPPPARPNFSRRRSASYSGVWEKRLTKMRLRKSPREYLRSVQL